MHLTRKRRNIMGLSIHYFIGGLTNPSVHIEVGGSVYFSNNISEPNFRLDSVRMNGNALELQFTPDEGLPAALRTARPNYLRLYPHETVDIRIKASLFEGDRTIEFAYFYDCVEKDGQLYFRKRTLSRIEPGLVDDHIGMCDEYGKLVCDGFKPGPEDISSFSALEF